MAFSGALMGSLALSGAIGAGAATAGAIGLGAGMAGAGAAFSGVAGASIAAAAPSVLAGSTAMGLGTLGSMAPSLAAPGFMAGMTGTGMAAMSPAMAAYGPMGWDMAAEGAFGSTSPYGGFNPTSLSGYMDNYGSNPMAYTGEGMGVESMMPEGLWTDPGYAGIPQTPDYLSYLKNPVVQRALGGLGSAGLSALFQPDIQQPQRQFAPYAPPTEFEKLLTGEYAPSSVEQLQRQFDAIGDLSKFGRENIREKILPFIFDADPMQDALKNFMPGSYQEFDAIKRARQAGFQHLEDYIYPYAESQRDFMSGIRQPLEALTPRLQAAALDPYSLSPTAATTVGNIEAAARQQLALTMANERRKIQQLAENRFGPDADLNVYLTQMTDPYAKQYSIGQAQLEEALGKRRLEAGLGATGALRNIYGTLGNVYGQAGQQYLGALGQVPGILSPITGSAGQILGMRQDLLGKGIDIKEKWADYGRLQAGLYLPTIQPVQEKSALSEAFGGLAKSALGSAGQLQGYKDYADYVKANPRKDLRPATH